MYSEKQFSIPKLIGLSEKNIEEHKKLYAGYVKHANLILEKLEHYKGDESKAYETAELYRRFSFEYNGIRNHECYFKLLEKKTPLNNDSALSRAILSKWQSVDALKHDISVLATTRGIGWAMVSWDPLSKSLILHWIDEQHIGQLQDTTPVIALDMWEHSYVSDYFPSGKKQYVHDFLNQLNWKAAEDHFEVAVHA